MLRLIIEPEAEADLKQAFAWYEQQRTGLGEEFLMAVEARLAGIRRQPDSFQSVRGNLRRAMTRRFPYGIFFVVEGRAVHILAVLHAKRKPTIWKQRMRK